MNGLQHDWSSPGVPVGFDQFMGKGREYAGGMKGYKGKGKGGLGKGKNKGKGKGFKGSGGKDGKGLNVKGKGKESVVTPLVTQQVVVKPATVPAPASPSAGPLPGARSMRRNHLARAPPIRSIKRLAECMASGDFSSLPAQASGQPFTWFGVGVIGNYDSQENGEGSLNMPLLTQYVVKSLEVVTSEATESKEVKSVEIVKVEKVESAVPALKPEVKPVEAEAAATTAVKEVKVVEVVKVESVKDEKSETALKTELKDVEADTSSQLTTLQSDGKQSDDKHESKPDDNAVAVTSTPRKKKPRRTVEPIRLANYVPQIPGQIAVEGQPINTDDI